MLLCRWRHFGKSAPTLLARLSRGSIASNSTSGSSPARQQWIFTTRVTACGLLDTDGTRDPDPDKMIGVDALSDDLRTTTLRAVAVTWKTITLTAPMFCAVSVLWLLRTISVPLHVATRSVPGAT